MARYELATDRRFSFFDSFPNCLGMRRGEAVLPERSDVTALFRVG